MRYFLFSYQFFCPGKMGFGAARIKADRFPSNKFVQDFAREQILSPMPGFEPMAQPEDVKISVLNFQEFRDKVDFENFCEFDNLRYFDL